MTSRRGQHHTVESLRVVIDGIRGCCHGIGGEDRAPKVDPVCGPQIGNVLHLISLSSDRVPSDDDHAIQQQSWGSKGRSWHQRRHREPENDTVVRRAAIRRNTVQIVVRAFHQRILGVRAIGSVKPSQGRQRAIGGDLEYDAVAKGATIRRCAIEVAIAGLDQRGERRTSIVAAGKRIKGGERGHGW